jgi:hypothetical protein
MQNCTSEHSVGSTCAFRPSGRATSRGADCTMHAAPFAAGHGASPAPQSATGPWNDPMPEYWAAGAMFRETAPYAK